MIFDKLFKNKSEQPQRKKAALIPQNGTLIDLLINTGVSSIGDDDMDMILADLTVTQCDVSRKSVTEKKEIQIVCDDEKIKDEFKKIFNPDVVSQILETYLYGLNVFEVNYKEKERLYGHNGARSEQGRSQDLRSRKHSRGHEDQKDHQRDNPPKSALRVPRLRDREQRRTGVF